MEARKLLYTAMVIAPAVALAGIGIHSQTYVDPFEWPAISADHDHMTAYLGVVQETTAATLHRSGDFNEEELRHAARRWISEASIGKLKPLVPVAYDDMVMTGVKGQIVSSMVVLHRALVGEADRHVKNGRYGEAAEDLLLSIRTADTLKYSSFLTVYRTSMLQANDVNRLNKIFGKLPEGQRLTIRAELSKLDKGPVSLQKIADHARKVYVEAIRRHADTEMAISTADRMIPAHSFFEQPALAKEKAPRIVSMSLPVDAVSPMLRLPNLTTDASLCVSAQSYLRLSIQRMLSLK